MPITVKLTGFERATSLLRLLGDAAKEVGRTRYRISSPLPYAHWIEHGRYASGRPGRRRAGPARMFQTALDTVRQRAPAVVARNLEHGPDRVRHALSGLAGEATKLARSRTPVVSGRLRDSIHSTTGPRG